MLFSEEWLRSHINPDLTTDELCELITMAGLEVEEVTPIAPPCSKVVVARVLECVDHPNSDHLHICKVDAGQGEPLQIVCGAPNVKAGVVVPCALVGSELPGGIRIKKGKLRGEVSMGMLCSARELGVTEDHSGLWILDPALVPGTDIREALHLDDKRIEIKLTPNRGDALSVIGVARDVRALTGAALTMPSFEPVKPNCETVYPVTIADADLCGRYTGRVIRNLNAAAPTPQWMRDRLERSGQRSISALVDISNYVMLELGRPTHFFDLDKIDAKGLTVRFGNGTEKLTLLNGMEVTCDTKLGVIADANGAQALAGIMGGEAPAISSGTKNLFIEAAFFFPGAIRGRARRLNFSTDASHRFERGVDYASTVDHMEYITRLVLEVCGTPDTQIGPVSDTVASLPERKRVTMRADRARAVIGMDILDARMAEVFTHLGFEYTEDNGVFSVLAPTYRFDIEIEEDLIEEVARLCGYQNLPDVPPMAPARMISLPEERRRPHDLRLRLAALGFQELVNFSFTQKQWEKDFGGCDDPIALLNPIASQLSVMRTQLIGGLVDILRFNINRKVARANLFECGRVFFRDPSVHGSETEVEGVYQPMHIAGLSYGPAAAPQWGIKSRLVDFYDVRGVVEQLVAPLSVRFEKAEFPALHPGRSAAVVLNGKRIGMIGELHPRLVQEYSLPHAPVVFELDVAPLLAIGLPENHAISKFQPNARDISVVVADSVPVQALFDAVEAARGTDKRLAVLADFKLFDVYRPQGGSDKSLAFNLLLQGCDEGISDEAADAAVAAVLEALGTAGAHLRQ